MSFQANHVTYEYQQSFTTCGWCFERILEMALVYVDNVMLFGTKEIVEGGLQSFRKTWETSEPTWVGEAEPVRYCGMELSRTEQGDFFANQWLCSAQLMKEAQEPEDELDRTPTQVREAQQLGGELLWLATKTRPDIAYVVSRICSATSRAPKSAVQTAYQLIRHLNATQGLGLWYRKDANFIPESSAFIEIEFEGIQCAEHARGRLKVREALMQRTSSMKTSSGIITPMPGVTR